MTRERWPMSTGAAAAGTLMGAGSSGASSASPARWLRMRVAAAPTKSTIGVPLAQPHSHAVCASMLCAVRIMASARSTPMSRGSRWVPP